MGVKCVGVPGGLRNRYSYIRIKNAPFVLFLNLSQMLTPAVTPWPIRGGRSSSLLPPLALRTLTGGNSPAGPLFHSPSLSESDRAVSPRSSVLPAPPWTEGRCWPWACCAGAAVWSPPSAGLTSSPLGRQTGILSWRKETMRPPWCCFCPNLFTFTTPSSPSYTWVLMTFYYIWRVVFKQVM